MPAAAADRLWLLGPGMARLSTDQGTVGDLATADGRSLAPGTFSAAARRILRSGPARTALTAAAVAPPPAEVLTSANRLPPPPPSRSDGVPFTTATETQFDQARRQVLTVGRVATASLVNAANALVTRTDTRVQAAAVLPQFMQEPTRATTGTPELRSAAGSSGASPIRAATPIRSPR